jgi:hypothetical protein
VHQQVAIAVCRRFFVVDERIVNDVRQNGVEVLAGHIDGACV